MRYKALAIKWLLKPLLRVEIALSFITLAISGCERGSLQVPSGLLTSRVAQEAGADVFAANCAICHGENGDGHGLRKEGVVPPPADLRQPPWSEPTHAARTFAAIRDGVRGTAMPAWPSLSDQQIWNVVAYIISLSS
jgi:mono/diheme cytochrome c family protein